jgi:regulatory factor X
MTKVFFHEMMVWQAEKGGFMRSTANSLQSVTFGAEQPGLGNFNLKQKPDGISHTQAKSNTSPSVDTNQARRRAGEEDSDRKHASDEKELALADAGFQSPNNDDSAIDLGDDPMMIAVGKYGDMMASDPADAEGDVVVI